MTHPAASRHDEWQGLPPGERRVVVGRRVHAYTDMIQIEHDDGGTSSISVKPPMFSEMDMLLNERFLLGTRRAILASATPTGWSADLKDVFADVAGHGCRLQLETPPSALGPTTLRKDRSPSDEITSRTTTPTGRSDRWAMKLLESIALALATFVLAGITTGIVTGIFDDRHLTGVHGLLIWIYAQTVIVALLLWAIPRRLVAINERRP